MGQYYTPIILDEDGKIEYYLSSHDFNNGLKLMEHSWLGNEFVAAVESLLAQEAPRRVVWAGDYADPEVDAEGNPLMGSYIRDDGTVQTYEANLYNLTDDVPDTLYRPDLPGLGVRYNYQWYKTNEYGFRVQRDKPRITRTKDPEVVPNVERAVRVTQTSHPFILNWDKREFVNKRRVPRAHYGSERPLAIHPLPLLTVEGNGRGGGDFHLPEKGRFEDLTPARGNFALIGSWARDHISVSPTRPDKWPHDTRGEWTEIYFDLVEMGSVDKEVVAS